VVRRKHQGASPLGQRVAEIVDALHLEDRIERRAVEMRKGECVEGHPAEVTPARAEHALPLCRSHRVAVCRAEVLPRDRGVTAVDPAGEGAGDAA
jgi:hypothetical protein